MHTRTNKPPSMLSTAISVVIPDLVTIALVCVALPGGEGGGIGGDKTEGESGGCATPTGVPGVCVGGDPGDVPSGGDSGDATSGGGGERTAAMRSVEDARAV